MFAESWEIETDRNLATSEDQWATSPYSWAKRSPGFARERLHSKASGVVSQYGGDTPANRLTPRGGGTSLFGLYGDVPLDRVWFFALAVLNRVYNLTWSKMADNSVN